MVDGFQRCFSPGKGRVPCDEDGRRCVVVEGFESFENDSSCPPFIVFVHFRFREQARQRHFAAERVGVRGTKAWNGRACLCEHDGIRAMRVGDSADIGESPIKVPMGGGIGRGTPAAVEGFAVFETDGDHMIGGQGFVRDPTGFNIEEAMGSVYAAGVAPG